MPKIKHHRSSRRVPPPKDSDFDHEIGLVDHSASGGESQIEDGDGESLVHTNSIAGPSTSRLESPAPKELSNGDHDVPQTQPNGGGSSNTILAEGIGPSVQLEQPTPDVEISQPKTIDHMSVKPQPKSPESAIDILYENQRGGFLCGMPLFSSKALGNLDPPPWTNSVHKTSPTNITNAQVPDPTWEWAWPEWRINHHDDVDDDGWEYSFMFSKKFSWHKPAWWNSFVRRRAWIRKRTKKENKQYSQDTSSMMFNPEYFTVRPSSEIERSPSRRPATSQQQPQRAPSRGSRLSISTGVGDLIPEDIETVDELLVALRRSRIDREKIEAVDNYLEHSTEDKLEGLQHVMHEIMPIFVFQASRRVLLIRLNEVYDQTVEKQKKMQKKNKGDGRTSTYGDKDAPDKGSEEAGEKKRAENLAKAIKHADEEVRRLEYWSDVKGMAEGGDSKGAVDCTQGWDPSWQGVDKSGPSEPPPPEGVQESTDKK